VFAIGSYTVGLVSRLAALILMCLDLPAVSVKNTLNAECFGLSVSCSVGCIVEVSEIPTIYFLKAE
jgi:hypothetical protein